MEAILKFNLPEDRNEHKLALKGSKYYSCLWEIDQTLRSILKHGHEYKDVEELAQYIRKTIAEMVDLDEIE